VPKHPELRLRLSAISDAEAKMELEPLMEAALEETQPQRLD
jgi:hypothetical protein